MSCASLATRWPEPYKQYYAALVKSFSALDKGENLIKRTQTCYPNNPMPFFGQSPQLTETLHNIISSTEPKYSKIFQFSKIIPSAS